VIDVVDFFSGCGGTSTGLAKAGLQIVLGLDNDPNASATFRKNFPHARFIESDIRQISVEALAPIFARRTRPILFSGCAPCQPFSKQNRHMMSGDPRRTLLAEFGRFVGRWMPDFIFVENVPGMQRISEKKGPINTFLQLLEDLGYTTAMGVLPALWFGVPQKRERLILLASKHGSLTLPSATHGPGKRPYATVRDWIGNLPPVKAGEGDPNDPDHKAATLSETNMQRIIATPEGGGRESWPDRLWLNCHKDHEGHSDVYGRLAWDRPASGLTTRCISYSNGRFGHPEQHRAITVREAACLQTFPRKYSFFGSATSKAEQVGNAVPPLMAKQIGKCFLKHARAVDLLTEPKLKRPSNS
jgi:DNA (cytosine-5)-methyltransferase 1